ncbi:MAG TPA: terminase family protein [Allosphingosinicella sp.]|nr:terminase family protein [Allosphingosinicella sp.]
MRLTPVEQLALLDEAHQLYVLRRLSMPEKRGLVAHHWWHAGQLMPDGDWRIGLILGGRGFGKTRAGAEWASALARADGSLRIALVGASRREVLEVMVRGPTGLMAVAHADEDLVCYADRGVVEFASGAQAFVYSGHNPDGLRGAQHHFAWCDELAKWRYPQQAWDNLLLGMRLGEGAKVLVTTTPKPLPLLKRLVADPATARLGGRTRDNDSLPADHVAAMDERYAGTRLGRQELDGELIEDFEGALWTREGIEINRLEKRDCPSFSRVVIGVDPPASAGGDACGIVACGLGADGIGYVLADASVAGLPPEGWAREVVRAAEAWEADLVVAETNQGGEMVESVLRSVDSALPVRAVKARYGKGRRAEPVSALFAKGKARFAGIFPALEDQLCGMTGAGYEGPGRSPDRADAMVWAIAELLLGERAEPRIRRL